MSAAPSYERRSDFRRSQDREVLAVAQEAHDKATDAWTELKQHIAVCAIQNKIQNRLLWTILSILGATASGAAIVAWELIKAGFHLG